MWSSFILAAISISTISIKTLIEIEPWTLEYLINQLPKATIELMIPCCRVQAYQTSLMSI